jgi:hypothetical protein
MPRSSRSPRYPHKSPAVAAAQERTSAGLGKLRDQAITTESEVALFFVEEEARCMLGNQDSGSVLARVLRDNQDETAATTRMRLGRGWPSVARA